MFVCMYAACQTLVSFDSMTDVAERAMECHFKAVSAPPSQLLNLPPDQTHGYGWKAAADSISLPEDVLGPVTEKAVSKCRILLLHCLLLKKLPQCGSLVEEKNFALKVLRWCSIMKPRYRVSLCKNRK